MTGRPTTSDVAEAGSASSTVLLAREDLVDPGPAVRGSTGPARTQG